MTAMISNSNVEIIRTKAASMGCRVTKVVGGRRHLKIYMRTDEGISFMVPVKNSRVDPHKLKGWTRQTINKMRKAAANEDTIR